MSSKAHANLADRVSFNNRGRLGHFMPGGFYFAARLGDNDATVDSIDNGVRAKTDRLRLLAVQAARGEPLDHDAKDLCTRLNYIIQNEPERTIPSLSEGE